MTPAAADARIGRSLAPIRFYRIDYVPYLLVAPAVLLLISVFVYPALQNAWLSLWSWKLTSPQSREFVGLSNYASLFAENALFRQALVFTLLYTTVTLAVSLLLGLISALLLHPVSAHRRIFVSLLLLPYVISPVAAGLGWGLIWAREFGLANFVLDRMFGIPAQSWLADPVLASIALMITEVWRSVPFVTLVLLAGLATIPTELYEAASLDGASAWQQLRFITLPLLMPSITVVVVFETIFKLRVFDLIVSLTGGGPGTSTHSLGLVLYRFYFRYFDGGNAAAVGMVLLLIGGAFAWLYIRLTPTGARA